MPNRYLKLHATSSDACYTGKITFEPSQRQCLGNVSKSHAWEGDKFFAHFSVFHAISHILVRQSIIDIANMLLTVFYSQDTINKSFQSFTRAIE